MDGQETTQALSTHSQERRSSMTSGRAIAVLLKPLIDLHGEPKNWKTAAPLYIDALADVPADLLAKAVKYAIAGNPYFPKPADLRLLIVEELNDRRRQEDERRRQSRRTLPAPPPPTPEDIAYVDRIVAQALEGIAGRRAIIQTEIE